MIYKEQIRFNTTFKCEKTILPLKLTAHAQHVTFNVNLDGPILGVTKNNKKVKLSHQNCTQNLIVIKTARLGKHKSSNELITLSFIYPHPRLGSLKITSFAFPEKRKGKH